MYLAQEFQGKVFQERHVWDRIAIDAEGLISQINLFYYKVLTWSWGSCMAYFTSRNLEDFVGINYVYQVLGQVRSKKMLCMGSFGQPAGHSVKVMKRHSMNDLSHQTCFDNCVCIHG